MPFNKPFSCLIIGFLCFFASSAATEYSYQDKLEFISGSDRLPHLEIISEAISLRAIWMTTDGNEGWAVGDDGIILHYVDGLWQKDGFSGVFADARPSSICMTADGEEGWALGGYNGIILHYVDGLWQKDDFSLASAGEYLHSIWLSADGNEGWAVGNNGVIMHYNGEDWSEDDSSRDITRASLNSIWMRSDGNEGWIVGHEGVILHYTGGHWQRYWHSGQFDNNYLLSIWMTSDGSDGWAVGNDGIILHYNGYSWQKDENSDNFGSRVLYSVRTTTDGKEGWAVGSGVILRYSEKIGWHIENSNVYGTNRGSGSLLLSIWMSPDGNEAWVVGEDIVNLHYTGDHWLVDDLSGIIISSKLKSVWLTAAGDEGWAVGDNGVILHYDGDHWQRDEQSGAYARSQLNSVCMTADGHEGWAVGDSGIILHYNGEDWSEDDSSRVWVSSDLTSWWFSGDLTSVWISDDGDEGWAAGEIILQYTEHHWRRVESTFESRLGSVWISANGDKGWAVGRHFLILNYNDGRWQKDSPSDVPGDSYLNSVCLSAKGDEGWAVGTEGAIFHYAQGAWKPYRGFEYDYFSVSLNSIWMTDEGNAGWIAGDDGVILYKIGSRWSHPLEQITYNDLYSLWMTKAGDEGWAVGEHGMILRYTGIEVDDPVLMCREKRILSKLDGDFQLMLDTIASNVQMELLNPLLNNQLKTAMYEISVHGDDSTVYDIHFTDEAKKLQQDLKGKKCRFRFTVDYVGSHPTRAVYQTGAIYILSPPAYLWIMKGAVALAALNILLLLLAIPSSWARKLILHPVGAYVLGFVVGRYLMFDFLIRFIPPIRKGLFRQYRKSLRKSPMLKRWENEQYIPPNVSVEGFSTSNSSERDEAWQSVFRNILAAPPGNVWLILGRSGLGKTAILEKWTELALSLSHTPIFIPLGSEISPQAEAAASMAQYGDIDLKSEVAFDLIKFGGFLVFIDGYNEDRSPEATRNFVRYISRRNRVVVTSQVDPRWERWVQIKFVKLQAFGRDQLQNLTTQEWVDKILGAEYLADLGQLPQTAKLLIDYINNNHQLPDFRLDIYRSLRGSLDVSTQVFNLEKMAWDLFKENKLCFSKSDSLTDDLCEVAVKDGILTKKGDEYRFRHERIHRFFVACYLDRQDEASLSTLHKEISEGFGKWYWADVVELWGELFAERASQKELNIEKYYTYLKDAGKFDARIFAERLYPQVLRLYKTNRLPEDREFYKFSAHLLTSIDSQGK